MSAYENAQKRNAMAQLLAQSAAGIGSGGPMGNWAANMGNMASNMAAAKAQEEAEKQEKKKKKAGALGKIGSLLGGTVGTLVGGPVLGGALGSALGGTAGQVVGGAKPDFGTAAGYGMQGAMGGIMGKVMPGGVAGTAGAGAAGTAAAGGQAASNARMADVAASIQKTAPGANTVLAPPAPVAAPVGGQNLAITQQTAAPIQPKNNNTGFLSGLLNNPELPNAFSNQMLGQGFLESPEAEPRRWRMTTSGKLVPVYGGYFDKDPNRVLNY